MRIVLFYTLPISLLKDHNLFGHVKKSALSIPKGNRNGWETCSYKLLSLSSSRMIRMILSHIRSYSCRHFNQQDICKYYTQRESRCINLHIYERVGLIWTSFFIWFKLLLNAEKRVKPKLIIKCQRWHQRFTDVHAKKKLVTIIKRMSMFASKISLVQVKSVSDIEIVCFSLLLLLNLKNWRALWTFLGNLMVASFNLSVSQEKQAWLLDSTRIFFARLFHHQNSRWKIK